MSNETDKIIYSMYKVTKRHGQREVLKKYFTFLFFMVPRSACWASIGSGKIPHC